MKFMVTVHLPTEAGNAFVKDPTFGEKLQTIFADQKAESVYFGAHEGQRCVFYVTDASDASKIASIAEPWWFMVKARVDMIPVMTPQDMQKAGPEINALTKKWG